MAETSVTVVAKRLNGVSSVSTNAAALDPYIKFLQKSNNIDVSFSSYLKQNEEQHQQQQQQQQEQEDAELSIFDARKYFSETTTDYQCQKDSALNPPRFSSASSANVSSFSTSFPVGHTASSEASWNSQTGLLAKIPRDNNRASSKDQRGSNKKGSSSGPRWLFRRRTCPCSSAKSVQVQENKSRIAETKSDSPDRIVQVSVSPISLSRSNPSCAITGIHHQTISSSESIRLTMPSNPVMIRGSTSIDDAARELRTPNAGFSFPILTQQSSEQTTKSVPNPTTSPKVIADEDAASDASSDLFEIESFSTSRPCAPRAGLQDSLDETATEYGYEPSEASVTWSVTTAEPAAAAMAADAAVAANLSSLASGGGGKRRTAGNAFLSCRCEKSVMVSGGQRPVAAKSVCVPNAVTGKVKLSVTNRTILDMKPTSFLV